jgi:hypothetical protein
MWKQDEKFENIFCAGAAVGQSKDTASESGWGLDGSFVFPLPKKITPRFEPL